MIYIYNLLAAILIGISIGAAIGQRNNASRVAGLIAIVLAVVAIVTTTWLPIAAGVVVFLIGQGLQRDPRAA